MEVVTSVIMVTSFEVWSVNVESGGGRFSETFVTIYQTAQGHIWESSNVKAITVEGVVQIKILTLSKYQGKKYTC
jgi:hypothetical protein